MHCSLRACSKFLLWVLFIGVGYFSGSLVSHNIIYFFTCLAVLSYLLGSASVQSLSHVRLFATPWTATHQASLSITNSRSLLKLMSIESGMPSNLLILCCLLLLLAKVSGVFGVSASASVLPMNIQDWFPLGWTGWISLQSRGLSRVFSNTTVQKHQFFIVTFSHPYMTTGKSIALTRLTFVGKVMSLLFNMLPSLVTAFLPGPQIF